MNVRFHKNFKKALKRLPEKIKKHTDERLVLFRHDPINPLLHNHPLKGKYLGYRSINITGDFRAIFMLESDDLAFFVDLDTHSNLYQ